MVKLSYNILYVFKLFSEVIEPDILTLFVITLYDSASIRAIFNKANGVIVGYCEVKTVEYPTDDESKPSLPVICICHPAIDGLVKDAIAVEANTSFITTVIFFTVSVKVCDKIFPFAFLSTKLLSSLVTNLPFVASL